VQKYVNASHRQQIPDNPEHCIKSLYKQNGAPVPSLIQVPKGNKWNLQTYQTIVSLLRHQWYAGRSPWHSYGETQGDCKDLPLNQSL
jgi:hypothetical protein